MEKCGSDLQSFIAYILTRQRKLVFLKKAMPEEELVGILINGLHPVMQQPKIHLRITTPKKWDEAVQIIRTHCASPEMVVELNKLKAAGLSQHMFPLAHPPQQMAPTPHRQQPCRNFARGRCNSGTSCRFSHTSLPSATLSSSSSSTPAPSEPRQHNHNVRCYNKGHVALDCRKRLSQLAAVPVSQTAQSQNALVVHTSPLAALEQAPASPSQTTSAPDQGYFSFVFLTSIDAHLESWVMDSGATSSATFDESDCDNVRDCDVRVTAAGSEFTVTKMGTARITALDERGKNKRSWCPIASSHHCSRASCYRCQR